MIQMCFNRIADALIWYLYREYPGISHSYCPAVRKHGGWESRLSEPVVNALRNITGTEQNVLNTV